MSLNVISTDIMVVFVRRKISRLSSDNGTERETSLGIPNVANNGLAALQPTTTYSLAPRLGLCISLRSVRNYGFVDFQEKESDI